MSRLSLLAVFLLLRQTESLTWEFGQDERELQEISHLSGRIKSMEKIKQIDVPLQPCTKAKYLLVEVFNSKSSPVITYNKDTSVVTISFTLEQRSTSRYDILVKGKKTKCNGGGNNGGKNRANLALSGNKLKKFLANKNIHGNIRDIHMNQNKLAGPKAEGSRLYLNIGWHAVGYLHEPANNKRPKNKI